MRNLKQALSDGLVMEKVHRVIKFYQEAWLKPYSAKENEKSDFKKDFKLMNISVSGKTIGNIRKHRYQAYNNRNKELFGMI